MRRSLSVAIVAVAISSVSIGCATGVSPEHDLVPPPPSAVADRVGIYAWGFDDAAWPGTPDRLAWAATKASSLGARVLRVVLSPEDPYGVAGGATALADLAARPAYAALWADPRFSTIVITAYTAADRAMPAPWSNGYSAAAAADERAQFAALARYLSTFDGKTFVLLPWEGDNAIAPYAANPAAWEGYVGWIDARQRGVADARAAAPHATAHVFGGLEFNAVRRLDDGSACDADLHRCVITYVAPRVAVDIYSYSSWQSLGADVGDHDIEARLHQDLDFALATVRAQRPGVSARDFVVGELGAARDAPQTNECVAAARTLAAIDAATSFGASYAVDWQIADNAPSADAYTGFGAFKYDGTISIAGTALHDVYAAIVPPLPAASCPSIATGGVVNGVHFDHVIHAGDVLSIFGQGFAASGNVVHVKQAGATFTVGAGSPNWYESAGQINFALPAGVGIGAGVRVYVSSGHDSNGQLIDVL